LADAVAASEAAAGLVRADLLGLEPDSGDRLLLAGCDPASSLLAEHLRRAAGVELIVAPSSSRRALEWLESGLVHVAGTHLRQGRRRGRPRAWCEPTCSASSPTAATACCWPAATRRRRCWLSTCGGRRAWS